MSSAGGGGGEVVKKTQAGLLQTNPEPHGQRCGNTELRADLWIPQDAVQTGSTPLGVKGPDVQRTFSELNDT